METSKLKKFAQYARRNLIEQVSSMLTRVLAKDSPARRENPKAVDELERQIKASNQEQVIEKIAYIWFNRFCALRFMDVNRYTSIGILSPIAGQTQPEILAEAKMGVMDKSIVPADTQREVTQLLNGSTPSNDPQNEAYRLLIVAVCNYCNKAMPFLFERIADHTELLMPDDLLSEKSILAYTREALTPDMCEDVEVIGWLYQFYISEKKDEVFDGLKKNKKITPENIPAATQLFTPHWIVRYLVENSLGRLWMLNHPKSKLVDQMEYYIKPEQAETDFLKISSPEELKICDPACGSGHMLVYAFDLLYAIYEEEGYQPSDIPEKILTHNLYGIEIDERAGELAAFALTMKARSKYKRFLSKSIQPNICVLENIAFEPSELKQYIAEIGNDLFTIPFMDTVHQFKEADNFGSLIRPALTDVSDILPMLEKKNIASNFFLQPIHEKVLKLLQQVHFLSPKYHVVIANPPYMGRKGMNGRLKSFLEDEYPRAKADLMTCFMERSNGMARRGGFWGMINLPSWMFLQSFDKLRSFLFGVSKLDTLLHLGRGIFGADFGSTAFTFYRPHERLFDKAITNSGTYKRLFDKNSIVRTPEEIERLFFEDGEATFHSSQKDFIKLPGMPVAYWFSEKAVSVFDDNAPLDNECEARQGMATADNERFLRHWHEVSMSRAGYQLTSRAEAAKSACTWFPYNKGGGFRKWYGNQDYLVNWQNDGEKLLANRPKSVIRSPGKYFRPSASWSKVTIGGFSLRYYPQGFIFDVAGCSIFSESNESIYNILGVLNTPVMNTLYRALMPTVNYEVGQISKFPYCNVINRHKAIIMLIDSAKADWDDYETSWNFNCSPLLHPECCQQELSVRIPVIAAGHSGRSRHPVPGQAVTGRSIATRVL